jgi:hypothetical protein
MRQAGGIILATEIFDASRYRCASSVEFGLLKYPTCTRFARILVGGDGLEPPTSCV